MLIDIQCPFCFEIFSVQAYAEDGEEQSFVYDCEVSCRPIDVVVTCAQNETENLSSPFRLKNLVDFSLN